MKVPYDALLVVADGGRMALYRNRGSAFEPDLELIEQEAVEFPRTSDIGADRPGRAFESSGSRRSAYEVTDIHDKAEEAFCRTIAERLAILLPQAKGGLLLVAAPRALGMIRAHLADEVRSALLGEIGKDYAGMPPADVAKALVKL